MIKSHENGKTPSDNILTCYKHVWNYHYIEEKYGIKFTQVNETYHKFISL